MVHPPFLDSLEPEKDHKAPQQTRRPSPLTPGKALILPEALTPILARADSHLRALPSPCFAPYLLRRGGAVKEK